MSLTNLAQVVPLAAAEPEKDGFINWSSITGEFKGALGVAVFAAAVIVIIRIARGDIAGFVKIVGCALLGVVAVGLMFAISNPDTAQRLVSGFIN